MIQRGAVSAKTQWNGGREAKMTDLSRFLSQCSLRANVSGDAGNIGQRKDRRSYGGIVLSLLFLLMLATLPPSAAAQENTASITGTIVDDTGAAIQGATVTAKDVDRGTSLVAATNESGAYNLPRVP